MSLGPELPESDFIHEGYKKRPTPLWVWFFLLTAFSTLVWGWSQWYASQMGYLFKTSPFLQVTNREMSLFLWQNPEFMRVNVREKNGYLPAFQYVDKVTVDLPKADDYVIAPPELLFRYHTWKRLVSREFSQRPIPKEQFMNFLNYAEEWQPAFWTKAPKEYLNFVNNLDAMQLEDLAALSIKVLPWEVRVAFQGWQNYFIDREQINQLKPTHKEMREFLAAHPHYGRSYWRNIVLNTTPNYLKSMDEGSEARLNSDELASFLRVAIYNFVTARKEAAIH